MQGGVFTPFLNLEDRVQYFEFRELGLLNVAFPPVSHRTTISMSFTTACPTAMPPSPDSPCPQRTRMWQTQRASRRFLPFRIPEAPLTLSGGQLLFGPDNFLYAGIGDSGFDLGFPNKAQNPQSLFGKILRIDVEQVANGYQIPADNPFVGNAAYLPEIWALEFVIRGDSVLIRSRGIFHGRRRAIWGRRGEFQTGGGHGGAELWLAGP